MIKRSLCVPLCTLFLLSACGDDTPGTSADGTGTETAETGDESGSAEGMSMSQGDGDGDPGDGDGDGDGDPGDGDGDGDGDPGDGDGDGDPVCVDEDMDGVTDCDGDCDDADPNNYPGNLEICGDGQDNDCDMMSDPMSCNGLGTYVSALDGDDQMGDGTQQNPVATINQGMLNAGIIGNGQPVFVAEGDYNEKVVMVEDIDLLGGYHCAPNDCTWDRDPATYEARIFGQDLEGVLADVTITRTTMIDGFTIVGQSTNPGNNGFVYAFTVNQGTPTITNNTIIGGDVVNCGGWCGTHGIRVMGPVNDNIGVLIDNNVIEGGDSPQVTTGIVLAGQAPGIAEITNNWIKGGTGRWTRGINTAGAQDGTIVAGNEIFAGPQGGFQGTSFAMFVSGELVIDGNWINHDPVEVGSCPNPAPWYWCGGIESEGAYAVITNNVIYGIPAPKSLGIFVADGEIPFGDIELNGNTIDGGGATGNVSAAIGCRTSQGQDAMIGDVRNNILTGGTATNTFAYFEDDQQNGRTCEPANYENNAIYDVGDAHRQWTGGGFAIVLPSVQAVNMQLGYAQNNVDTDCDLDQTWHLMGGSPCIDAGTMTEAPMWDIDGDARPNGGGIDIGADEAG